MEILASLRRRWILAYLLLLITLGGTAAAYLKLPWTYQSESSIVFLVPKNVAKSFGGNPYLAFNTTLNETADVVRYETMDERTVDSLAQQGYTSSYLVSDATDTAGPVLIVTVTGHDQAAVEHTLQGVTNEVSTKLAGLQVGLTPGNLIRDAIITFTPKATVLTSKKVKDLVVALGLGLVLTIAIPVLTDAQRARPAPAGDGQMIMDGRARQWEAREQVRLTEGRKRSRDDLLRPGVPVGQRRPASAPDEPGRSDSRHPVSSQDDRSR
jgi:hypothetical protein